MVTARLEFSLLTCYRERREADVRELEKAKIEQLEKQRAAEQAAAAVHKHFEESFRVAKQKVSHALTIHFRMVGFFFFFFSLWRHLWRQIYLLEFKKFFKFIIN